MGLVVNLLNKIALSNSGTKFYNWSASPKGQDFLIKGLPGLETIVSTGCYITSSYHQYKKGNLDERRHRLLQYQNVLSGVVGYVLGSWASRKTADYVNKKVIPNLKIELIPDAHKVKLGLQVVGPLICTALLMRGVLPAILAWVSGKIEERKAEKEAKLNKSTNTWNKLDTGKYFNKVV